MNEYNSRAFQSAEHCSDTPKESLGKRFLRNLRNRRNDDIVHIDGLTGRVITCSKFIEKSIKLACAFKDMGLKCGDSICIISENSIEYSLAILAAYYLGIAVGALNPEYTIDEIRHGFQFFKSKVILCSKTAIKNSITLKTETSSVFHIILLEEGNTDVSNDLKNLSYYIKKVSVDIETFEPEDFDIDQTGALILLSSGTTGLPKGVLLTHRNFISSAENLRDPQHAVIKPDDRLLTVLPFFHMFGYLALLATLEMSITTIILNKFSPATYLHAIEQYQPSKLFVVTPLLSFLATSPIVNNYNVSSIKECISSGSNIGQELLLKMVNKYPWMKIRQSYGITETTGFCMFSLLHSSNVNALVPLPSFSAKIRHFETFDPVGLYEHGEICLRGPNIMKEYIGNTSATQNAIDEDGFFISGDIGYYDEDGYIYFIGRLKEVIKYKGFQVAPTELEQLILTHPKVEDCGVVGLPDEICGELPMAFVVRKNGQSLTEEEVVNYVSERISRTKRLYGGVRFVDGIPKNHLGKILRKSLKEML